MGMNYPTKYPEKLSDIPSADYVVLDLDRAMDTFRDDVQSLTTTEVNFGETMDLLLGYICEKESAERGLERFKEMIEEDHDQLDFKPDGKILSKAVEKLGHAMIDRMTEHGLYSYSGIAFYQPYHWLDAGSLILQKYIHDDDDDFQEPPPLSGVGQQVRA